MPQTRHMTLYEVQKNGYYHARWLAASPMDAARRAISHAQECGVKLDCLDVSSMAQPEDPGKGGLAYVVNDARAHVVERGRVRRTDLSDGSGVRQKGRQT